MARAKSDAYFGRRKRILLGFAAQEELVAARANPDGAHQFESSSALEPLWGALGKSAITKNTIERSFLFL